MASRAWKAFEREVAAALRGERILRGDDFSKGDVDVKVPDFPELRIDAKYRTAAWKHHNFLRAVRRKYAADGGIPILVTKNAQEHGSVVSLSLSDFGNLLDLIRGVVEV